MEGDQRRNMDKQKEKKKSEKPEKADLKKRQQVCVRNAGRVCTTVGSDDATRTAYPRT
jgi:hypothetical protein